MQKIISAAKHEYNIYIFKPKTPIIRMKTSVLRTKASVKEYLLRKIFNHRQIFSLYCFNQKNKCGNTNNIQFVPLKHDIAFVAFYIIMMNNTTVLQKNTLYLQLRNVYFRNHRFGNRQ